MGLLVFDRLQRDTLAVIESKIILIALTPNPATAAPADFPFVQLTPVLSIDVAHNLGYRPSVSILSLGGAEMEGHKLHLSENVTRLSFTLPTAFQARFL
jgi:hypothetical protein